MPTSAANRNSATSTSQSRGERRPSGAARSSPGSSGSVIAAQRLSPAPRRDPLPKSIGERDLRLPRNRPPAVAGRAADPDAPRHDRSATPHQAARGARRRRRRLLPLRAGHRDRVPGSQRRGQDDDAADALRAARADAGAATVLGVPYRALPNPGRRVGILLDAAAQHDGRRGREALGVSAQTMGVDERRADELLARVGLDGDAARKRGRHYSLGMRQRLGIAHALLGDPEVLILDEPANGLDPEGMRWMRELLRDFADRGGTVLLSSHLLYEVEAVADQLVIIGAGRIAARGDREELLAGAGTLVEAGDEHALRAALDAAALPARASAGGGFVVEAAPAEVGRAALAADVALTRLGPSEGAGLEQLFFDLTTGAPDAVPSELVETIR